MPGGRVAIVVKPLGPLEPTRAGRRAANEEECKRLKKTGLTHRAIAVVVGLHYKTVAVYCQSRKYAASR